MGTNPTHCMLCFLIPCHHSQSITLSLLHFFFFSGFHKATFVSFVKYWRFLNPRCTHLLSWDGFKYSHELSSGGSALWRLCRWPESRIPGTHFHTDLAWVWRIQWFQLDLVAFSTSCFRESLSCCSLMPLPSEPSIPLSSLTHLLLRGFEGRSQDLLSSFTPHSQEVLQNATTSHFPVAHPRVLSTLPAF